MEAENENQQAVNRAMDARQIGMEFGKKQHEIVMRQFENLTPACLRCGKLDADHGQMKSMDDYFGAKFKLVQVTEIRDGKDATKIIGWMADYRCEKGHGITMRIDRDRGLEAFKKKILTQKDLDRAGIKEEAKK
jgi:hypothetical protein